MATVYRRKRSYPIPVGAELVTLRNRRYARWTDDKTGKLERAPLNAAEDKVIVESEFYTVQYFDHNGKRRKVYTRYADKDAAQQYANKLEKEAEDRRRGLIDDKAEQYAAHARRVLTGHLEDFEQYLRDKQNSNKHIDLLCSRLAKLIDDCEAEYIANLTEAAVMEAIGAMRAGGASLQTCNHYLRGVKQFSRWLQRQKRTPDDPLAALAGFNAATDRRYVRRELTPEEMAYLLRTVESYTTAMHNMPGPDRAMAYRVALGTGFRAKELRSLTPASFDLDSDPPTVTVAAAYSKRRRQDVQPIRPDLAELLRPWLAAYGRDEHPFAKMPERTARMLRDDLDEARRRWLQEAKTDAERAELERSDFLKHIDADGRVLDFHGTRHTYISAIVAGGASVKTAQELARHSTPTLTIGRYSHTRSHDLAAALDALPSTAPAQSPQPAPESAVSPVANASDSCDSGGHSVGQYSGKMGQQTAERGEKGKRQEKQEAPVGVEPTNGGFANRRRTPETTGKTGISGQRGAHRGTRRGNPRRPARHRRRLAGPARGDQGRHRGDGGSRKPSGSVGANSKSSL